MGDRFATLTFERAVAARPPVLWQAWTAPAARAVWSTPAPSVSVAFHEADTRAGGREVSVCRVAGEPDIRCVVDWLIVEPEARTLNCEVLSTDGVPLSAALVTARIEPRDDGSLITVTVQLSSLAQDMEAGYRQGFGAGLDNLAAVAERTMIVRRRIDAPREAVFAAWANPATLPSWWGPDGFSCRTERIDLRPGGEWVFDMIASDGTVYPNHHRYVEMKTNERIAYTLLWGENGPKHADAWAAFDAVDGSTLVTLGMVFVTAGECVQARSFGAEALGLQTLGKLARSVGTD